LIESCSNLQDMLKLNPQLPSLIDTKSKSLCPSEHDETCISTSISQNEKINSDQLSIAEDVL